MKSRVEIYLGVTSPGYIKKMESVPTPLSSGSGWAVLKAFAPKKHSLSDPTFEWPDEVIPRWAGPGEAPPDDTSRCLAAINPYPTQEAFDRFREGRKKNGDIAVSLCEISSRRVFKKPRAELADDDGIVCGSPLPKGVVPTLSKEAMTPAERQLAELVRRNPPKQFHSLALMTKDGKHEIASPDGLFKPLLIDDLGKPLVAVWTPSRQYERWYVIPEECPWSALMEWLVDIALPEHLPDKVARRLEIDDELRTVDEIDSEHAYQEFVEGAKKEGGRLKGEMISARERADMIRRPLLFETGETLVQAVQHVVESFGWGVENLDHTFGYGASADLLIAESTGFWLLEVRGGAGAPSEDSVGDLRKHLVTWTKLGRTEPLKGGILVLNPHNSKRPALRAGSPYFTRPGFVESLDITVIGTVSLFGWWRDRDSVAFRCAVEGSPKQY